MGVACVSSYANLFLGLWEREIFLMHPVCHIEKVLLWTRYIDNILMVWHGPETDLLEFTNILNNIEKNIKLTIKCDQNAMEFLDVYIFKDCEGYIQTDMYCKDMSVNALLHASSSHPAPKKKIFPQDNL